jgi:ADP-ribosylglycohydrolase
MGLVVGDALGVPVQFMTREEIRNRECGPVTGMEAGGVYDMPEGTWSDDSSMALATMASLLEKREVDLADIMMRFVKWELKGEYTPFGEAFDEGNTCSDAIYKFIAQPDVNTCGKTGEYANGNGALMRILPACLYYYERTTSQADMLACQIGDCRSNESVARSEWQKVCTSEDEAIYGIHAISGLTHNHLRGQMCCGIYYFMAKHIIEGANGDTSLQQLMQDGINEGLKFYGRDIRNLTEMAYLGRLFDLNELKCTSEENIIPSGYVVESLEAAIWCLITTSTLKECLLKAVNLGDDTDTIAAIAGGLAGLYYGYEAIPQEWLEVIKRRDWIEGMCEKMCI